MSTTAQTGAGKASSPPVAALVKQVSRKRRAINRPCKHFGTTGTCPYDPCWYVHDRALWERESNAQAAKETPSPDSLESSFVALAESGELRRAVEEARAHRTAASSSSSTAAAASSTAASPGSEADGAADGAASLERPSRFEQVTFGQLAAAFDAMSLFSEYCVAGAIRDRLQREHPSCHVSRSDVEKLCRKHNAGACFVRGDPPLNPPPTEYPPGHFQYGCPHCGSETSKVETYPQDMGWWGQVYDCCGGPGPIEME
eukprot:TRINITY_DN21046_c0_g1_i1.p1 TRINITY_DN21046_c0_g1~~TRINITY_DN21046_c0_g1_i1.p1  ORF type:complete len:258 (-),score=69.73 TRINITY_DN21046_c0_g1_i1:248-1021(-)